MTKAKEIKDLILTEREQEMIKWIANKAYAGLAKEVMADVRREKAKIRSEQCR